MKRMGQKAYGFCKAVICYKVKEIRVGIEVRWHFSITRLLICKLRRQWYRLTGNWIMEGLQNTNIAGIKCVRRCRKEGKRNGKHKK